MSKILPTSSNSKLQSVNKSKLPASICEVREGLKVNNSKHLFMDNQKSYFKLTFMNFLFCTFWFVVLLQFLCFLWPISLIIAKKSNMFVNHFHNKPKPASFTLAYYVKLIKILKIKSQCFIIFPYYYIILSNLGVF